MRLNETIASDGASSVVAVVTNGNGQILLGKSTDADHRNGKWCFTGGGIKNREITIEAAAERECWEESGLHCRAQGIIQYGNGFEVPPSVVFVLCLADAAGNIQHNKEFSEMKWALPSDALAWPDLFAPNRRIIERLLDHPLMEGLHGGQIPTVRCHRCDSDMGPTGIGERLIEPAYCSDETCPFSDHEQHCPQGWGGHPAKRECWDRPCACRTREVLPEEWGL